MSANGSGWSAGVAKVEGVLPGHEDGLLHSTERAFVSRRKRGLDFVKIHFCQIRHHINKVTAVGR